MEPFELALSQVNFEEKDLSSTQPLHSFSNLVSYDSDFQDGNSGSPIIAKRVSKAEKQRSGNELYSLQVADAFKSNGESRLQATYNIDYHNYGPHANTHLVNGSDTINVEPEQSHLEFSAELKEAEMVDEASGRRVSLEKGNDSFRAFTDTVEALALQRSVIGSSSVTPASAEEIAKVIAITQKKLKTPDTGLNGSRSEHSDVGDSQEMSGSSHMQGLPAGASTSDNLSYTEYKSSSMTVECHTSSKFVSSSASSHEVVHTSQSSHTVKEEDAVVSTPRSVNTAGRASSVNSVGSVEGNGRHLETTSDVRNGSTSQRSLSADERSSSAGSPELIPVPADMITKVTERTGGWLAGRGVVSPEHARPGERSKPQPEFSHPTPNPNPDLLETTESAPASDLQPDSPDPHKGLQNQKHPTVISQSKSLQDSGQLQESEVLSSVNNEQEDRAKVHQAMMVQTQAAASTLASEGEITGVAKLKGEYDFDTNSYLETMATFKSLQTSDGAPLQTPTGTLVQEDLGHRFSPPVKDPGLQPPGGKRRPGKSSADQVLEAVQRETPVVHTTKKSEVVTVKKVHFEEDAHVLLDKKSVRHDLDTSESVVLPFQVPVDTSTPLKSENGGNQNGPRSQGQAQSSKKLVLTTDRESTPNLSIINGHISGPFIETSPGEDSEAGDLGNVDVNVRQSQEHIKHTSMSENIVHLSSSTKIEEVQTTHSRVTLDVSRDGSSNLSRITQDGTQNTSLMVEFDSGSQNLSVGDDTVGDLSLGNSSAAAGEGASMSRSERSEYNNLKQEVATLRRVRAHLEGKVEILEGETRVAIKERSEVQSHLAAIMTQLKSQESNTKNIVGERSALAADLETLKQNRHRLELVVMDAQKLIEEKDHDLRTLHEDLKISHSAGDKLQEKMKGFRQQLQARDETVQALKNKVAELYVEFQTTKQGKILVENELGSVQSTVKSLIDAKEWYQEQLKQSQMNKGKLQQELSRIQSESITSVTLIERLKADNVRIKHAMNEQQQRALQEKEMLARHLEAIEGDMMERESAYTQIQQERESIEAAMKVEEERLRKSEVDASVTEDLKKLKNELRRKQAQVNVLEHEQSELVKRLTLAQESILERDRTIDSLNQKQVEVDVGFRQALSELLSRDEDILKLKNERNSLQIELNSTKEEKESFDNALHTIKDDMGKVEKSFRQMKLELAGRTDELTKTQNVNEELNRQLAAARARLRVLTHNRSDVHGPQNDLSDDLSAGITPKNTPKVRRENFELAPVHKEVKEEEELVVQILEYAGEEGTKKSKPEVVILTKTEVNGECVPELGAFPKSSTLSDIDNAVIVELQAQRQALEQELEEVRAQSSGLEEELKSQCAKLEQQLTALQQELEMVTLQRTREVEERTTIEQDLIQTKERILEMEVSMRSLTEAKINLEASLAAEHAQSKGQAVLTTGDQEALQELRQQNTHLKTKMAGMQKDMMTEIARQKAKVVKTVEEYEIRLEEERSRHLDFQALIVELNQRLREVETRRAELETKVQAAEKQVTSSMDEEKAHLQNQTQALHIERQVLEEERKKLRIEIDETYRSVTIKDETIEILRTKISEIEVQYREARDNLEEVERLRQEEDAKRLSLDLEREKGRLAGVLQSHTALKEHTSSLEAALARREASVAGLSTHVQGELHKRDKYIHDLQEKIRDLETSVTKEKQNVKDTKKQLMTEKGQHIKLRRQMEALWMDQDQLKVDLQTKTSELQLVSSELEKLRQGNVALKLDTDKLNYQGHGTRIELEDLRKRLLEHEKQDQMVSERIQTMEWQLTQKTAELDALTEQLRIVEEREKTEVLGLNHSLQIATSDMASLKEQLAAERQEKLNLLAKVAQLKSALKASMSHSKKRKEMKEADLKSEVPPFDMAALERLLQDTAPVTVQSKPLSFLKATLNGLRGEISNLQTQINEHTSTVQTSSQAWKELEVHVKELRAVCKTSAAGRAASQTTITAEAGYASTNTTLSPEGPEQRAPPHDQAETVHNTTAKHRAEAAQNGLENI